jgi:hypothetical protein
MVQREGCLIEMPMVLSCFMVYLFLNYGHYLLIEIRSLPVHRTFQKKIEAFKWKREDVVYDIYITSFAAISLVEIST